MNNVWFSSDFHFCHDKQFLYGPRGFESIIEHDEAIIQNWNELVKPHDDVYILGDLMLNNDIRGAQCVQRLNGILHIVLGNHDTETRANKYCGFWNVESIKLAERRKFGGLNFFLCHYPTLCGNLDNDKPLKARVINLCGHTHTRYKFEDINKGLIYHVELDAHGNKPVALDQIIEDIKGVV